MLLRLGLRAIYRVAERAAKRGLAGLPYELGGSHSIPAIPAAQRLETSNTHLVESG